MGETHVSPNMSHLYYRKGLVGRTAPLNIKRHVGRTATLNIRRHFPSQDNGHLLPTNQNFSVFKYSVQNMNTFAHVKIMTFQLNEVKLVKVLVFV